MFVQVQNRYVRVCNVDPLSVHLKWIGFVYQHPYPRVELYFDYSTGFQTIDKGVDEILFSLVEQAAIQNDEQAALCAYDRLVELGYLQLPEE